MFVPLHRHQKLDTMKTIYTSNEALLEVLTENGIDIICDDRMEMTISDEDAARIPEIVAKYAPAAINDLVIEDNYWMIDGTEAGDFATLEEAERHFSFYTDREADELIGSTIAHYVGEDIVEYANITGRREFSDIIKR